MKLIFSESPSKTVLYLRSLIDLHIKPRRTVRLSGKLIAVNRPPARCEDVIFVTSTFHMSMESSFETQCKVEGAAGMPGEATGTQNPTGVLGCKKGSKRGVFNTV